MKRIKIDVNDYTESGLGDIYYGLISFISQYVRTRYNPMEVFENNNSKYAMAITIMKAALKELLDYFKANDVVYLSSLKRSIKISNMNIEEQIALEEKCKEYLITKLNEVLDENIEIQTPNKKI